VKLPFTVRGTSAARGTHTGPPPSVRTGPFVTPRDLLDIRYLLFKGEILGIVLGNETDALFLNRERRLSNRQ